MSDLVRIDSKKNAARLVLVLAVIVAALVSWVGARRQLGNLLNEITGLADSDAAEIAEIAESMAPADPLGMWLRASLSRNVMSSERKRAATAMFENTVRLAPDDFRWWIELGRAYEQTEEFEKAETALRHSVSMAPTYNYPRWQLGNFLLRRDRPDEAFAELKLATVNNYTYREQVFSLAWDYFDKDPAKVEELTFGTADDNATLAMFYAVRGRAADALRVWSRLSVDEKQANVSIAKTMTQGLHDRRFFNQSLAFARDTGVDTNAAPETITNGGFESGIGPATETYFGWRVSRGEPKVEISTDSAVKNSGSRSLRIGFRGFTKAQFYNVYQTVAVRQSRSYRLRFRVRTESLKSAGPPQIEIVNGNDGKLIVASQPFAQGTNDWAEYVLPFTTPENCEGVYIRTARSFCGENCPLVGTLWYDDFVIEPLG